MKKIIDFRNCCTYYVLYHHEDTMRPVYECAACKQDNCLLKQEQVIKAK